MPGVTFGMSMLSCFLSIAIQLVVNLDLRCILKFAVFTVNNLVTCFCRSSIICFFVLLVVLITLNLGLVSTPADIKQGFKRAFSGPWPQKLRYQVLILSLVSWLSCTQSQSKTKFCSCLSISLSLRKCMTCVIC